MQWLLKWRRKSNVYSNDIDQESYSAGRLRLLFPGRTRCVFSGRQMQCNVGHNGCCNSVLCNTRGTAATHCAQVYTSIHNHGNWNVQQIQEVSVNKNKMFKRSVQTLG